MKGISLTFVPFVAIFFFSAFASADETKPTAILGAFDPEVKLLQGRLRNAKAVHIRGIAFHVGTLEGKNVILALTGVGKVNAAMTTTLLIDHFKPKEVIFTGISGGLNPKLLPGDIVIGRSVSHHDYGLVTDEGMQNGSPRNPIDGKRNPIHIPSDPKLLTIARQAAKNVRFEEIRINGQTRLPAASTGVVGTGDVFVASARAKADIRRRVQADVVEMEGAAVAQVCYQLKTSFLIIRSVSDLADKHAEQDMDKFYKTAANNSAKLVVEIVKQLVNENKEEKSEKNTKKEN
ncbi:MAG: 5'-methylthioadenosine/adenosylhomocysteine nucleosidase [Phycisphaerae bacterium]|nr:5'-methylthioadenosine/adenosylhomocysteine nucleosidase [Phycisphaerae bacterium]